MLIISCRLIQSWPRIKHLDVPSLNLEHGVFAPLAPLPLLQTLSCRTAVFQRIRISACLHLRELAITDDSFGPHGGIAIFVRATTNPPLPLKKISLPPLENSMGMAYDSTGLRRALSNLVTVETLVLPISLLHSGQLDSLLDNLVNLEELDMSNTDCWTPQLGPNGRPEAFQSLVPFVAGAPSKLKRLVVSQTMLESREESEREDLRTAAMDAGVELVIED